ncbi:MAG: Xylose isomerase protein barrel [Caulobacteraceae bacterium]|nr:Xylose isomerase protein barrel [Caulobacteraceae bacterium]
MARPKIALLVACSLLSLPSLPGALAAPAPASGPCVKLDPARIGLQLYSVRTIPATAGASTVDQALAILAQPPAPSPPGTRPAPVPANPTLLDSLFGRLHAIGYQTVESAGHYDLSAADLKTALAKNGLKMIGGHDNLTPAGFDAVMDYAVSAGQSEFVGSSGWGPVGNPKTLDGVMAAAANLNALGKRAADRGLRLYVHNHTDEFTLIPYDINHDGKLVPTTAWEILAANTDPRYLTFEIDIYWLLQAFKGDEQAALTFVRKNQSRISLYHVKEAVGADDTELGKGSTHWSQWWTAAPGVKYYIFEYEGQKDPIAASKAAFDYMTCKV